MSITSINTKEPQPHDSQNWIIEPSDYRYITKLTSTTTGIQLLTQLQTEEISTNVL